MHTNKIETVSQTDIAAAYKRPVLRKRDIRARRRVNHAVSQ